MAEYHGWKGAGHVGAPIEPMVERVRHWLAQGREVRIFTARVSDPRESDGARDAIDAFCSEQFGRTLPVTNVKDFGMLELWDDRAVTVKKNDGAVICAEPPLGWTP